MKRSLLLLLAVLALSAHLAAARASADQPCAQGNSNATQNHPDDLNAAARDLAGGIVVEEIRKNSEAEKAGLREGDVLLRWVRGDACGDIASPFDLYEIEIEQEPRGAITLEGLSDRKNEKRAWNMGAGSWRLAVRPQLAGDLLSLYLEARELEKANKTTEAAERWQSAAGDASTDPRSWLSSWFLLQAAKVAADQQRWKESDRAYADAIQQAEQSGPTIKAQLLYAWAESYQQRSDWTNAEKYYRQSIDVDQMSGDESLRIASTLNNLGNVAYERGDLTLAEQHHRQALGIRQKLAPQSLVVAASLDNLGIVVDARGDLMQAERYYEEDLEITQRLAPGSLDLAESFINLGFAYYEREDLARAEQYFQQALKIGQKLAPESAVVSVGLNDLGLVALEREEPALAEKYFQQTLSINQKLAPGSLDVAGSFGNLGLVAKARGDLVKAREYQLQALEIEQKLAPGSLYAAESLQHLCDLAREQNDLAKAEEYCQQALAIREKLAPESAIHAESLAALASIQRGQQQPDAAAQLYKKALSALESQSARLGGSGEIRASFRAYYESYYREYADLLLSEKQPELAFGVLERSHARSLLELLATGHVDIQRGVDAELLAREKSLQGDIAAKSGIRIRMLSEENSDSEIGIVAEEIFKLEGQYNDVEGQIRASSPVYAALTQPDPLNAQQVQEQLLDADTMLLEYSLGEERSYVFAVTQNSVVASELPKRAEIEKVARRLYDALTARNREVKGETEEQAEARWARADAASRRASAELSQMILGPVAELLGKKRLLIVGDGVLQYIPFSALSVPEAAGVSAARPAGGGSGASTLLAQKVVHRPLALEHEIVNLPSASVLAELRRQESGRQKPDKMVAVLADPVFYSTDERVEGRSQKAFPLSASLTRSMDDVGVGGTKRASLHRLLYTRQEANAILSFTPAGQGMKALDFQASRATAMSESLAQYRIVHFATHGLLDSKHPEFSGLVLSMVNREGKAQDGFLGLEDIYNLKLPVDLVVLSGCETALGQEISGEGLIGLTRGFMYAGASRVVASLWSVDDAATSELMTHFYKAMERGGMPPAAALRAAQMEMWKQKAWNSPYYWASFQIQGEWR